MHRAFRKALDDATGISKSVIVVIIDVRGFSAFSMKCESPDTAMFIKRVYMKLIDSYFPFASFYKPTGDGLVLTFPFGEKNLREVAQEVISGCIACHSEFGNICSGDPMINFEVPDKIGIGVARGTACCLASGKKTIDYSGRLLNLTSRLTDIARPSGIVIDGAFNISLLTNEQQAIFKEDNVYLPGIAEDNPIKVYFTPEFTTISKYNKQPIAAKRWREIPDVKPYRELLKLGKFSYQLESEPTSANDIKVTIQHSKVTKGKVEPKYTAYFDFDNFTYRMDAGKPVVILDFNALCERLKQNQVKKNMNVTITIAYVEK
jgi:class 3 adenylate cyclase